MAGLSATRTAALDRPRLPRRHAGRRQIEKPPAIEMQTACVFRRPKAGQRKERTGRSAQRQRRPARPCLRYRPARPATHRVSASKPPAG
nr:MAG TPA: hypothetical protein [Caudoviricetes sp.]